MVNRRSPLIYLVMLLLFMTGCDRAGQESQKAKPAEPELTRPVVAASDRGPWGEAVNGVRCRIIYAEELGAGLDETRRFRIWIEVENVGDQERIVVFASPAGMPYIAAYYQADAERWSSDQQFMLDDTAQTITQLAPSQTDEISYWCAFDTDMRDPIRLKVRMTNHGSGNNTQWWVGKIESGQYTLNP